MRNLDLAAELGAALICWGGREGAESGAAKDVRTALDRYREAFDVLADYVLDQRYDSGSRSSRSRTSRAATSCCPRSVTRSRSSVSLSIPSCSGVNPEVGHEEMAGLNYAHGIAQALWHGKLFHIDLNGQNGPRYDQDLRFGAGNARVRSGWWTRSRPAGTTGRCTSTTSRRVPRTTTAYGSRPARVCATT